MNYNNLIFEIFDYQPVNEAPKLFKIHFKNLKHGWIDIGLKVGKKSVCYTPNTYCLPINSLIEGALFSLNNIDKVGEEFEFNHDAEQDGYCFWDLKIIGNQKLKLLVRLNPDLQLTEEITELGLEWAFKEHEKEIETLKEDVLIAIEINCLMFAQEVLKSINQLSNKISFEKYKKRASEDFPIKPLIALEKAVSDAYLSS